MAIFWLVLVVDCFKATVDALVKSKASLSAVDTKHRTPLHYLVIHSRLSGALWSTSSFDTSQMQLFVFLYLRYELEINSFQLDVALLCIMCV